MDQNQEKTCKVVLVGDSGVGKTSVLNRFISKGFSEVISSTLGSGYGSRNMLIENEKVTLEIWDTAGQERYAKLTKLYLTKAEICILIYDITKSESLLHIRDIWIPELKETVNKEKAILGIAANKSDLSSETSTDIANELGKENNAEIFEISAKNNIGIEEMFTNLTKKYLKNKKKVKKEETIKIKNVRKSKSKKNNCCHKY